MRGSNLCGGPKRPLRSKDPNAVCQAHMHRLAQRGARQLLGTCLADLCEEMMAKRQIDQGNATVNACEDQSPWAVAVRRPPDY